MFAVLTNANETCRLGKWHDPTWFLTSIIRRPNRFDWNAVTRAVPCANSPSNSVNAILSSVPADVYFACKRNNTTFAGVIDTSLFNRSSIDPLVNYHESPGTNHHCGDTVTGHRSILVCPCSFLPAVSLNFAPLFPFVFVRASLSSTFPSVSTFFFFFQIETSRRCPCTLFHLLFISTSNNYYRAMICFVNLLADFFVNFFVKWNLSSSSAKFYSALCFHYCDDSFDQRSSFQPYLINTLYHANCNLRYPSDVIHSACVLTLIFLVVLLFKRVTLQLNHPCFFFFFVNSLSALSPLVLATWSRLSGVF